MQSPEHFSRTGGKKSAFTLIELLIVVGIVSILALVVTITLNPVELLRQARDSTRIGDMATIKNAINLYLSSVGDNTPTGFPGETNPWRYYLTVTTTTIAQPVFTASGTQCIWTGYVLTTPSVVTGDCTGGSSTECSFMENTETGAEGEGIDYYVSPATSTAQARAIDGTGWIGINFTTMTGGSPISSEPIDPVNQAGTCSGTTSSVILSTCGLFYSFISGNPSYQNQPGTDFEISAQMESRKYFTGGSAAVEAGNLTDPTGSGCVDPYRYDIGTSPFVFSP